MLLCVVFKSLEKKIVLKCVCIDFYNEFALRVWLQLVAFYFSFVCEANSGGANSTFRPIRIALSMYLCKWQESHVQWLFFFYCWIAWNIYVLYVCESLSQSHNTYNGKSFVTVHLCVCRVCWFASIRRTAKYSTNIIVKSKLCKTMQQSIDCTFVASSFYLAFVNEFLPAVIIVCYFPF